MRHKSIIRIFNACNEYTTNQFIRKHASESDFKTQNCIYHGINLSENIWTHIIVNSVITFITQNTLWVNT